MKGVDDLDFYIGDEAVDKPSYSTKVRCPGQTTTTKMTTMMMKKNVCGGHRLCSNDHELVSTVADSSRDRGGLGPHGALHGADHLQVPEGGA